MKIETRAQLDKAQQCPRKARVGLDAAAVEPAMAENAARDAYYAAFHAAKALIFERTGKTHKSHSGVHMEFNRLAKDEIAINRSLRAFLKKAYDFKSNADYETGIAFGIGPARAAAAIGDAGRLVDCIATLMEP